MRQCWGMGKDEVNRRCRRMKKVGKMEHGKQGEMRRQVVEVKERGGYG